MISFPRAPGSRELRVGRVKGRIRRPRVAGPKLANHPSNRGSKRIAISLRISYTDLRNLLKAPAVARRTPGRPTFNIRRPSRHGPRYGSTQRTKTSSPPAATAVTSQHPPVGNSKPVA